MRVPVPNSPVAGLGSKMGIDAINKWAGETPCEWGTGIVMDAAVKTRVDEMWASLGLGGMSRIGRFLLLSAISLMVACNGTKKTTWQEEVQLAEGSVIVVHRSAEAKGFGEMVGPGGLRDLKEWLQVGTSPYPPPPPWNDVYVPILFDYDVSAKEWVLVATFYMCEDWYQLGRPKSPYLEYRVRGGKWERVPLDSTLVGRETNLLTGPNFIDGEPSLLSLQRKQKRRGNVADKFLKIQAHWHTSC